jgi:hypothetical protein
MALIEIEHHPVLDEAGAGAVLFHLRGADHGLPQNRK